MPPRVRRVEIPKPDGRMPLEVAEAKSGVKRVNEGFEFLGLTVLGRFLRPRPAALARFKDRVRALTDGPRAFPSDR